MYDPLEPRLLLLDVADPAGLFCVRERESVRESDHFRDKGKKQESKRQALYYKECLVRSFRGRAGLLYVCM